MKISMCAVAALAFLSGCGGGASTQGTGVVLGETMTFRSLESRQPTFQCQQITRVYSYGGGGVVVTYTEGKDYTVVPPCALSRTAGSAIPDMLTYHYTDVDGNSDTVMSDAPYGFVDMPRNPGDIMQYNIYVDYVTAAKRVVSPKAHKQHSKVFVFGDSISGGAVAASVIYGGGQDESFFQLLRDQYPTALFTDVFHNGGGIETLYGQLDTYIGQGPDLVILEFGMNDHLGGDALLPAFTSHLDTIVSKFVASGIDVILVGFFQQNTRYNAEHPADTRSYNAAIRDVATKYNVPFADVYTAFADLGAKGKRIEDMTGDFMHHPTSFGHAVYFSLIAPHVGMTGDYNDNPHFLDVGQ